MHCTKCGAELEDNASFCTACGTPVSNARSGHTQAISVEQAAAPDSASPFDGQSKTEQTSPQQPEQEKAKKKLVVPIVIAAIVAVVLIVAVVVILINQGEEETKASPSNMSATTAQDTAPTFENNVFRITLPADIANKVTFQTGTHLDIVYMSSNDGNDLSLAEILPQNQSPEHSGEAAHVVYSLGTVDLAGSPDEAIMDLTYVDANGSTIYMGRPESATLPVMTGIEKYLGMTPEEFAACIEIKTANGFERSIPRCISNRDFPQKLENAKKSSGVPTSAFWGIWAQASKDKAEMEAAAQRMRSDYGFDAFVVLTTDWSNLNSEPWYCVSLGSYSSEDAANAALSKARSVYSDAYVKYSGSKK